MSRAVGEAPSHAGTRRNVWQLLLNLLVWALILLAVARPVFVEKPIERQQPVRDLMLAIDISQSMETEDFTNANGEKSIASPPSKTWCKALSTSARTTASA